MTTAADRSRTATEREALAELERAFGPGARPRAAWAPGRCTIVGEHVDYAGGRVLAAAVELGVAVALRAAADGVFRAASRDRIAERSDPGPVGDIGDRIFAAAVALRHAGIDVPAFELGVAATLPESAGLASSAALTCAVLTALLRLSSRSVTTRELVDLALHAERDIAGIPCGPLDQHVVVEAPRNGVLLLDCTSDEASAIRWPWDDASLCLCATGEVHDVGGEEYAERRDQVGRALSLLRVDSCQEVGPDLLASASLGQVERRRLRHVVSESRRAFEAAAAINRGDLALLGRLMSASHRSLREDHEVSTDRIDAVVQAAQRAGGCLGARVVGAGFGGSVVALAHDAAVSRVRAAMANSAGTGLSRTWALKPAPGLRELASDVFRTG